MGGNIGESQNIGNSKKLQSITLFLWRSSQQPLHRRRMFENGIRPQVWGTAGLSHPQVALIRFYPHYPQPLLLLRFHINIYILLESIKGILYNSICKRAPFYQPWEVAMDIIKVSANSRTSAVAGAIAGVIREHKRAEVQAIGAGAVNQAVKAWALATGYLKADGLDVVCVPEFVEVQIEDKVRTAIKLVIEPR